MLFPWSYLSIASVLKKKCAKQFRCHSGNNVATTDVGRQELASSRYLNIGSHPLLLPSSTSQQGAMGYFCRFNAILWIQPPTQTAVIHVTPEKKEHKIRIYLIMRHQARSQGAKLFRLQLLATPLISQFPTPTKNGKFLSAFSPNLYVGKFSFHSPH